MAVSLIASLNTEREIMRATFEADSVLPVEAVASAVGCHKTLVYATYRRYGVSTPKNFGVNSYNFSGKASDPIAEKVRIEKIRASVKLQHAEGKKTVDVKKLQDGVLKAHARGDYFGIRKTDAYKANMRESLVRAYAEGRMIPRGYRGERVLYQGIRMRSKLEAEFARQLDEAGISWQYEPKMFRLSWCTYLPDFYLPETDTWVECKGWMSEIAEKKIHSFRKETGLTLSVVWYTEVFGLNVKSHGRYERKAG